MNTVLLYQKLIDDGRLSASGKSLLLDTGYLDTLAGPQLDVAKVKETVACYFPQGRIQATEIQPFTKPSQGARIRLDGKGHAQPFTQMSIHIEVWTEERDTAKFELRLIITAYGAESNVWTIATGFPFYKDSLLGGIKFAVSGDSNFPLLTLASHEVPSQGLLSGLSLKGLLDADSLQGANLRLFLGDEANSKFIAAFGTIASFPSKDPNPQLIHPHVSLYGGLPERTGGWKLGGLFPIENIRYSLKGTPDYSTARRQWVSSSALMWVADLVITPSSSSTEHATRSYQIPIGVEVYQKDGAIRFWSDLREGLSLAWDLLANSIPGTTLAIPTTEFQVKDLVKLTEFQLLGHRNPKGEVDLNWISLRVETNEEKNRWVLIDQLLTLNAIDFVILVRNPISNPSISFSLSGLFGIGKEGVLRLTSEFDYSKGGTDYAFSGQLIDGTTINITEILTHFLGHSQHPHLPETEVRDFSFSVQPKSKVYEGEIVLHGDWPIPGFSGFSLHDVFFRLHHSGEDETSFQAVGVFDLAGAQLFVSADYVSNSQGWTFAGGTYEQGKIPIGKWSDGILKLLGLQSIEVPAPIKGLELSDLGVRFNTETKDFSFRGTAEFPLDGKSGIDNSAKLTIQADRTHKADAIKFTGALHLLKHEFAVAYGSKDGTSLLVATYDNPQGDSIDVNEFVGQISTDVAKVIPKGLKVSLKHAQLAFGKKGDVSKFLFGIELGAGIELSQLPLVGSVFDRSQTLSVVFQVLAANANFEREEVSEINRLTASGVTKLPEGSGIETSQRKVQIKAVVRMGEISKQLDLPLETDVEKKKGGDAPPPKNDKSPAIISKTSDRMAKWVDVQKAFGPFHFKRVGVGLNGENIDFLLDASLQMAGLTITLEGLAAECALTELSKGNFKPAFHLDGLGVDFKRGELEIGGALLRVKEGQYDGALTLHYKKLGIQAFGSYRAEVGGHPSLFVYALVDYPIGGPPFFYVEGLALGFGYNRTIKLPTIDEVSEFPLVKYAMAKPSTPMTPMEVVAKLGEKIPPAVGEYFVTAGVRFTSFKNISGFVLLTALFGQHFEIDVLGKATVSSPPNVEKPLVSASLALLARFAPDEGELKVMAKLLPDAYVFSPDCHLTGGFAFYCWFGGKHKGDFALTLGGYSKFFDVPEHYPRVPRLGLNWQVDQNLKVTAEAFFALTPSVLMAGGNLAIVWQSGNLKAWFTAGVDFLIAWQPFHYHGDIRVSIGASYTFKLFGWRTVSVELAADLTVWGPPFSGIAHVKWLVISFDVAFGDRNEKVPDPIKEWSDFQKAFLPNDDGICTIAAQAGKVAPHGSKPADKPNANRPEDLGVINPCQLSIVVNSAVPVTKVQGALLENAPTSPVLGIAPMNKKHTEWECLFEIKIKHDGNDESSKFVARAIKQAVPEALWDEQMDPEKRSKKGSKGLIDNAVCGYEIRLRDAVSRDSLAHEVQPTLNYHVHDLSLVRSTGGCRLEFTREQTSVRDTVTKSVQKTETRKQRQQVLSDLLSEFDIDWTGVTVESWRAAPTLVSIG